MLKSQELKAQLKNLINESKLLATKEGVTAAEIENKTAEIETLKAKISLQQKVEAEERTFSVEEQNRFPVVNNVNREYQVEQQIREFAV